MKNQETQKQEKSTQIKKGKGLRIAAVLLGTIAIALTLWFAMFADASTSRNSTPAEIAAQEEFQHNLIKAQEEFSKKVDAAAKEAEQKSDSIIKEVE